MRTSARCSALLLGLLVLSARSGAAAPGTEETDCPVNPTCLSLLQEAREQSSRGNLDEAARLYKAAYEVRADPGLLFNIARMMHKQGQTQEAIAYYEQFLNSTNEDAEQKRKARDYLSQLQRLESPSPPVLPVSPTNPVPSPNTSSDSVQPPTPLNLQGPLPRSDARVASTPLYKKWWLWQLVGTVVSIGIGGAVGAAYTNRGVNP
jgi:tetratricopeptide (TPR) repeat protein